MQSINCFNVNHHGLRTSLFSRRLSFLVSLVTFLLLFGCVFEPACVIVQGQLQSEGSILRGNFPPDREYCA